MKRPPLVNRLDFATQGGDEREVPRPFPLGRVQPRGLAELILPDFLGHRGRGRVVRVQRSGQTRAKLGGTLLPQGLDQAKRQRATGKDLRGGVARAGFGGRREMQFGGVELACALPELRGRAVGNDLQAVVPGPFAGGAETVQAILEEAEQGRGFGGQLR